MNFSKRFRALRRRFDAADAGGQLEPGQAKALYRHIDAMERATSAKNRKAQLKAAAEFARTLLSLHDKMKK